MRSFAPAIAMAMAGGCMELSPFETDLEDFERDHTERGLERLRREPAPEGPLRFAVISDSHSGFDELADLIRMFNARGDLAFVLHLGDMTDFGLRQEFVWTLEELEQLQMPFLTVIGNHDTLSNGAEIYRSMFGAYNYTFVYEGVRLVLLNNNAVEMPNDVPSLSWVERVTAPTPGIEAVIVAAHQVPQDPGIMEILAEQRVSALVTGHIHSAKVYREHGVPAFRVGTVPDQRWALFSVDRADGRITVELCHASDCDSEGP